MWQTFLPTAWVATLTLLNSWQHEVCVLYNWRLPFFQKPKHAMQLTPLVMQQMQTTCWQNFTTVRKIFCCITAVRVSSSYMGLNLGPFALFYLNKRQKKGENVRQNVSNDSEQTKVHVGMNEKSFLSCRLYWMTQQEDKATRNYWSTNRGLSVIIVTIFRPGWPIRSAFEKIEQFNNKCYVMNVINKPIYKWSNL